MIAADSGRVVWTSIRVAESIRRSICPGGISEQTIHAVALRARRSADIGCEKWIQSTRGGTKHTRGAQMQ
jgi:hypothetical protein